MLTPAEDKLRSAFKYLLNPFMLLMWRMGMGVWFNLIPVVSGRVLVITHTGRKSGRVHRTPVNYAQVEGELYCVAGFGRVSDWYRNILANPNIEVWLPDGWWAGRVENVSDDARRIVLMRQVLIGSGFAAYTAGIDPYRVTDEQLAQLTASYRLIRIRRTHALTGAGGPGDLAWVWQVATWLLLFALLWRRSKRPLVSKQ